jgi:hypothetical protein
MNTSTKVFATLSLSAAIGEKIKTMSISCSDLRGCILGEELREAGHNAAKGYPFASFSAKKVIQVGDAVSLLLSGPAMPSYVLSMLIAGLIDIRAKCNKSRWPLIDPVIDCAKACIDLFQEDEEADIEAFDQYQRWIS